MQNADVLIAGAGLAGLAAARVLTAAGASVIVLEARDRVGGRTENGTVLGRSIEFGGQWIGPGQDRMYELVDEVGLTTFPTYDSGDVVLELRGRLRRTSAGKGELPRLGPLVMADLIRGFGRFDRLAATVELGTPWATPDAPRLDGQTFDTWVDRNLRTPTGRAFFRLFAGAIFAAEASDFSALHTFFYAKSGIDLDTLGAVDGGAQQDRIEGGSALLGERMAASLGARVRLGEPVRSITHDAGSVIMTTRLDARYRGARAIVTLPPTLAGRVDYDPPLPGARDQLTQRLPAGSVIKMHLAYERPFWRDRGLNGQAVSDQGPITVTFDNTPADEQRGVLLGFLEGRHAREWAGRTPDERKAVFTACAERYFGPEARDPIEYVERDWMAEPFTRGCYGAHFPPGVWTAYGPALTEPVGALHWAGTECAPEWNGYMEGAVRSGESVAAAVLAELGVGVRPSRTDHGP
ncbi:MAG TPA: flavin monoamine oxidase family protein [Agromyces sp.]|nr:flavin monoamine oxidase family protein [Agromyces sp.]